MSKDKFIQDWLERNIPDEQLWEEGKEYFQKVEFENMRQLFEASKALKVPKGLSNEEAWEKISSSLPQETSKPLATKKSTKTINMWRRPWLKYAAAVIVLLIAYGVFVSNSTISKKTGIGEMATVNLPDGSIVTLNAGSELNYATSNWDKVREVHLIGEAFFEIEKGTNFVVESEMGKIKVLGTSFNVKTRENQLEVACYTGKVEVELNNGLSTTELTKGLYTKISNSKLITPLAFNQKNKSAWKVGEYHFESTPLSAVFDELERQFEVELSFETSINKRVYTGFFNNSGLENALEMICLPMNLEYDIIGEEIIIK